MRPLLGQPAVADGDRPVGEPGRPRIVADLDQTGALAGKLGEHVVDPAGGGFVKLAGRLVGEQQPGAMGHGSADRHLLGLAPGQLRHRAISQPLQAQPLKGRVRGLPGLLARHAGEPEL